MYIYIKKRHAYHRHILDKKTTYKKYCFLRVSQSISHTWRAREVSSIIITRGCCCCSVGYGECSES